MEENIKNMAMLCIFYIKIIITIASNRKRILYIFLNGVVGGRIEKRNYQFLYKHALLFLYKI